MGPLVVLAYSGGLDTSAIVPWLREKHAARVLCFAADVGQGTGELAGLVDKAKRSGAIDCTSCVSSISMTGMAASGSTSQTRRRTVGANSSRI